MLPALVSPFHDTDGLMFSHLKAIAPQLKSIFARAYLNISPFTQRAQAVHVDRLQQDSFFQLTHNPPGTPIGDQFLSVYARAAHDSPPAQVLHLCFLHRVAFALQTQHKDRFVAEVLQAADQQLPLLFQRSPEAWDTHPRNYREIEQVATQIGEHLFNQRLDFAWCHLALQAQQLQGILPRIRGHDLDVLTEIVLLLKDSIETRDVDWLAWQDPFLHSRDPGQLKQERENSLQETQKRLGRLIPVLQRLVESTSAGAFARAGRKARSTELTTAMGSKVDG